MWLYMRGLQAFWDDTKGRSVGVQLFFLLRREKQYSLSNTMEEKDGLQSFCPH